MTNFSKPINRALFVLCVIATGSIAGAFVWAFFFLMDKGIEFFWSTLPALIGQAADAYLPGLAEGPFGFLPYPLIVCIVGGLLIGYFDKKTGARPEELTAVMGKVNKDGRYSYEGIGKLSLAALLPLLFGGSIGPEAGLTGVIAGLCTWVGDRMRRFGADFRALTAIGTQAALTALFTAPLYGFVAPLAGTADAPKDGESDVDIKLPRAQKTFVYLCAIAGALAAFLLLGDVFGGGWACRASQGWKWARSKPRWSYPPPSSDAPQDGPSTHRPGHRENLQAAWESGPSRRPCSAGLPSRYAAWRCPTPCLRARRKRTC